MKESRRNTRDTIRVICATPLLQTISIAFKFLNNSTLCHILFNIRSDNNIVNTALFVFYACFDHLSYRFRFQIIVIWHCSEISQNLLILWIS